MVLNRLKFLKIFVAMMLFSSNGLQAQTSPEVRNAIRLIELKRLNNDSEAALKIIANNIIKTKSADDLSYLYAYQSALLTSMDSLLLAKKALDKSANFSKNATSNEAKAVYYRAKAHLNRRLNLTDEVVKDAKKGLKLLEKSNLDPDSEYHLNYLLYAVYSKWKNIAKMDEYIRASEKNALQSGNKNNLANAYNGISSTFLAKFNKEKNRKYTDSSYGYLQKSFALHRSFPGKVSSSTFAITCVNLANYFLEQSNKDFSTRKSEAFQYLQLTESEIENNAADPDLLVNIYGIKSDFAAQENNWAEAEELLLTGLKKIKTSKNPSLESQYNIYKRLAEIALKRNDFKTALNHQNDAENILKKSFDQKQIFNAQKLEIQYETEKKDQEIKNRKTQNYLYLAIMVASLFGLIFMFSTYHFRLKYSIEREKKIQQEKDETERNAFLQLQLEREEQARLKAEQELLELQQKQLKKEAVANALIIERKNETLKNIQDKLKSGENSDIQKLLRDENQLNQDFEEIKFQIHNIHPNFYTTLSEKANKTLTPLDMKYCAYINLQLSNRQIAKLLHVEETSVRMFKYRLKQKLGLDKETDLEDFLKKI